MVNFLKKGIDLIDEGIIVIDHQGKIKVYNQEAACIFGLDPRIGPGHQGGRIADGDLVIIADNCLGGDDGQLTAADLAIIGVAPGQIKASQAFVVIGRVGSTPGSAHCRVRQLEEQCLVIASRLAGSRLEAKIDFGEQLLKIKVNQQDYPFPYALAAGHLVVVDGPSGAVKFYQTRGYTARQEDIKSILSGKKYIGKGPGSQKPVIYDQHISAYHPSSGVISRLLAVAKEQGAEITNRESIINGIPVRSTIAAIREQGRVIGAVLKIVDIRELKKVIAERDKALNSIRYLEKQLNKEEKHQEAFQNILGISKSFAQTKKMALIASETISNVLLLGESGTGKNLLARAIHQASSRKNYPFIYINCASIPEGLFESELFGYEKGSFTGALTSGKKGKLELAERGTVFLDEIVELTPTLQAKILHFLQSKTFTPVGGVEEKKVNVRLIFATNKDLEELVEQGRFREDLYFRINVLPIILPPLRERPEDIPLLARSLTSRICQRIRKTPKKIEQSAMELLINYEWKGNIRELENVLERAVNVSAGKLITPADLPEKLSQREKPEQLVKVLGVGPIKKALEQTERELLFNALNYTEGSRKKAMELLGLGKTAFYQKLKKYRLD